MHISALTIFPVKSLGPVALESAEVTPRGLWGDRRWMLVDEIGRFVTRRELPALARIGMVAPMLLLFEPLIAAEIKKSQRPGEALQGSLESTA